MTAAAAGPLSAELQAERRKVRPPVQLTVPKGGVAFRELRVWVRVNAFPISCVLAFSLRSEAAMHRLQHRGQPNRSPLPRHMLCLGWCAHADPDPNVTAAGGRVDVSTQL